jgi:hypothetical protein
LETWKLEGWTITWVGVGEQLQAVLCAGDHLRSEAKEAVNALRVNLEMQKFSDLLLGPDKLIDHSSINISFP